MYIHISYTHCSIEFPTMATLAHWQRCQLYCKVCSVHHCANSWGKMSIVKEKFSSFNFHHITDTGEFFKFVHPFSSNAGRAHSFIHCDDGITGLELQAELDSFWIFSKHDLLVNVKQENGLVKLHTS